MAKKKVERIAIKLDNIAFAEEKLNTLSEKKDNSYRLQINTSKELTNRFKMQYSRFLEITKQFALYSNLGDFFRIAIVEKANFLKEKKLYKMADKTFLQKVKKSGRRPQGGRDVKLENRINMGFIFEDDTQEIYDNIIYSLASAEQMQNILYYTVGYFFEDILIFLEENIEQIAEKYKAEKHLINI